MALITSAWLQRMSGHLGCRWRGALRDHRGVLGGRLLREVISRPPVTARQTALFRSFPGTMQLPKTRQRDHSVGMYRSLWRLQNTTSSLWCVICNSKQFSSLITPAPLRTCMDVRNANDNSYVAFTPPPPSLAQTESLRRQLLRTRAKCRWLRRQLKQLLHARRQAIILSRKLRDDTECPVCLEAMTDMTTVVIVPCGHLLCRTCSESASQRGMCLICKAQLQYAPVKLHGLTNVLRCTRELTNAHDWDEGLHPF
jgi:hypothetical protein